MEEAILSIGNAEMPEDRLDAERHRDRLLCNLPPSELVTETAKRLVAELASAESSAEPTSLPYPEKFGRDFSETGMLAEQGVSVEDPPNRRIREIARPLKAFVGAHLNPAPTAEEVESVLPVVQALYEAIHTADADGVHPAQKDAVWTTLAAACSCLTHAKAFACNTPAGDLVRNVLLEAASHPLPPAPETSEDEFEENVGWNYTPRGDAAAGLTRMTALATCCRDDVLASVERLARDPVSLVRLRVVEQFPCLRTGEGEVLWRILEGLGREERNLHVLLKALTSIPKLNDVQMGKIAPIVQEVFSRTRQEPKAGEVRIACLKLCLQMESRKGDPFGGTILAQVLADVGTHANEVDYLVKAVASNLVLGPLEPADSTADLRRRRTIRLFEDIAAGAAAELRNIQELHPTGLPEPQRERVSGIFKLSESLSLWVYFTSGADEGKEHGHCNRPPLEHGVKLRFLRETSELFDVIADVPHPRVIHSLLQVLEAYVPVDPREVFLRVGRIVRAGRQGGYEFESMGADLVVSLVRRYLADYRELFRDHPDCVRTLMDLLDTFIQAGWPNAFKLTYHLEELFR